MKALRHKIPESLVKWTFVVFVIVAGIAQIYIVACIIWFFLGRPTSPYISAIWFWLALCLAIPMWGMMLWSEINDKPSLSSGYRHPRYSNQHHYLEVGSDGELHDTRVSNRD